MGQTSVTSTSLGGKCPLYKLGNLRRLRMVGSEEFASFGHHSGYILLSIKGERPEHDKAASADFER